MLVHLLRVATTGRPRAKAVALAAAVVVVLLAPVVVTAVVVAITEVVLLRTIATALLLLVMRTTTTVVVHHLLAMPMTATDHHLDGIAIMVLLVVTTDLLLLEPAVVDLEVATEAVAVIRRLRVVGTATTRDPHLHVAEVAMTMLLPDVVATTMQLDLPEEVDTMTPLRDADGRIS